MTKKICIITGTRAEYGLLRPLIDKINLSNDFELKLVATAMHLSLEFGLTYKLIEADGFIIDKKIEILLSSDTAVGISKSVGLAIISFSEYFSEETPDLVIVLGDRFEIFSVVTSATLAKIPVAHVHGGETTEGAYDEAFRHCISKMSYLHFTSTEEYKRRVIQLGEDPSRVFNVGALGVENIKRLSLIDVNTLEDHINFKLDKPYGLVTFHAVTLETSTSESQVCELLMALDSFPNMKFLITKGNSDSNGRIINSLLEDYSEKNKDRIKLFTSMGQIAYLSAMKHCSMVLGNSSSGIIEAPTFNIPTINIGDRQKGRIQTKSIINCTSKKDAIIESIKKALNVDYINSLNSIVNPYDGGDTSCKIMDILIKVLHSPINLKKKFYDL